MLRLEQIATYWDNVRAVTARFLDVFPAEHLDFRPVDTLFTAREQLQHLIASQAMFVRGWTEDVWSFPWQDGRWVARELVNESFDTLPGLRRFYGEVHLRALRFLRELPPDAGSRIYQTHMGPLSIDAMALYAIDEEIHHRAQLAVYLRCLGIRPPAFVQRYQDLSEGEDDIVTTGEA
jgi:uncharacterized damage-inducible protein DinB